MSSNFEYSILGYRLWPYIALNDIKYGKIKLLEDYIFDDIYTRNPLDDIFPDISTIDTTGKRANVTCDFINNKIIYSDGSCDFKIDDLNLQKLNEVAYKGGTRIWCLTLWMKYYKEYIDNDK